MTKIKVIAHPNARKPRIESDPQGQIHVYVTASPYAGKANTAVLEALASYLEVKKNQLQLQSGENAKVKIIAIFD